VKELVKNQHLEVSDKDADEGTWNVNVSNH